MVKHKTVILGGYGTFGRLISEQLAAHPDSQLIIAGRRADQGSAFADSLNAEFRQCDANDQASLRKTVEDAWLVVNASGPFKANHYEIPKSCIAAGSHYIDLADGRDYVANIVQLDEAARAQNVMVCAGASTTPAITSALVSELQRDLSKIQSIKVCLNAGNKNQAGVSTIATILSYVGVPVQVWQDGGWRSMRGWSAGEFVEFPPPVGRRRVQLCDVPDLAIFPEYFQASEVIFKAGVELTVLNYLIGMLAKFKQICPLVKLPSFAKPLVSASKLFKPFGTSHGGCAVWVTDAEGRQKCAAVVARENGPRIPGSPAILLARKLPSGEIAKRGAFPCIGLQRLSDFAEFLAPFKIFVADGQDGNWNVHR